MVACEAKKRGWDVVLLSEVKGSRKDVVWLGQAEKLAVVLHLERAGVLLRGEALKRWCEGGQRKKWDERHVSVKVEEWVLVATYMPVWTHDNDVEIEGEGEAVGACEMGGEEGGSAGRRRLQRSYKRRRAEGMCCGCFGLRSSNTQGESLNSS